MVENNHELRKKLIKLGLERSKIFNWKSAGENYQKLSENKIENLQQKFNNMRM